MEDSIIAKIKESIRGQISNSFNWLDTKEGRIISRAITSLGSFAVGDPTGIVIPLIIESSDDMVRKKFVKHFPDLMKRLQREEGKINQEFLKSDLGQHLLRDVLRKIIKETDEEKIDSLKTFLVNSCTTVDEYWIDKCYKILLKMKPVHIHILSTLSSPERIVDTIIAQQDKTKGAEFYPPNGFNEYYFKIEPSIFEDVIDELIVWNVLGKIHNSNSQTHLKFNEDWLRSVIINSPHITDFGKKLLEYLKK